jgi:hypothetical protein
MKLFHDNNQCTLDFSFCEPHITASCLICMLYHMVLSSIFVGQYIPIAMGIILTDHGSIPLRNIMLKAPCIDFVTLKQIAQS